MNCANHPDRERLSFCQNCGKPLCQECTRPVGAAVFCEPCLAARLAAADATRTATGQAVPSGAYTGYETTSVAGVPIPSSMGAPNPVLAAWLGFIPGVGAMYNGQYAKGVVHLIVFAVLVSLADTYGVFGIFIAGWEFYMAFEAYHTARARRDGTPLPNPFGLNDIGDRFGFGNSWPAGAPSVPVPPAASAGAYQTPAQPVSFSQGATGNQSFTGADGGRFAQTAQGNSSYTAPPQGYGYTTTPPFSAPYSPVDPALAAQPDRFPLGALWLIGLGLLFFFGSTGWLRHFPIQRLLPFFLIGLGIWLFARKMTSAGQSLTDDGSSSYTYRAFCALRGSVWVVLVGVLFLLDTFDILSWGRSWPLFIIVAGVMALLQRYAYAAPFAYPAAHPITATAPAPDPPVNTTAPENSLSILPRDPEER